MRLMAREENTADGEMAHHGVIGTEEATAEGTGVDSLCQQQPSPEESNLSIAPENGSEVLHSIEKVWYF